MSNTTNWFVNKVPDAVKPYAVLQHSDSQLIAFAWSPSESLLAAGYVDGSVELWDVMAHQLRSAFSTHVGMVSAIAWDNVGRRFATGGSDSTVQFRHTTSRDAKILKLQAPVCGLAWIPNTNTVAAALTDGVVLLLDSERPTILRSIFDSRGQLRQRRAGLTISSAKLLALATGHGVFVIDLETTNINQWSSEPYVGAAWSPDGTILAASSPNRTVTIFDSQTGTPDTVLEGHVADVGNLSFDAKGTILATGSTVDVRFWKRDGWEQVGLLSALGAAIAQFDRTMLLATAGPENVANIWTVDAAALLRIAASTFNYSNAKVVLVGDTGVGKSGLALALTGQQFTATESTHARRVWILNRHEALLSDGRRQLREIFLWDLVSCNCRN